MITIDLTILFIIIGLLGTGLFLYLGFKGWFDGFFFAAGCALGVIFLLFSINDRANVVESEMASNINTGDNISLSNINDTELMQILDGTYRLILDTGIVYTITFLSNGQALIEEPTRALSEVVEVLMMPCLETSGIKSITFLLEEVLSFEVLTQNLDNEELILVGARGQNAWLRR